MIVEEVVMPAVSVGWTLLEGVSHTVVERGTILEGGLSAEELVGVKAADWGGIAGSTDRGTLAPGLSHQGEQMKWTFKHAICD